MLANVPAGYQPRHRRRSTVTSIPRTSLIDPSIQISIPTPVVPPHESLSLFGLLASKRLAKHAAHKMYSRRPSAPSRYATELALQQPTYRMEPLRIFDRDAVYSAMRNIVTRRMRGFQYSPDIAGVMTKILTDDIKDAVKELNFDRYKIVCVASIGQRQGQGLKICSRCTWDISTDNHCTYTWNNDNVFCTATVFGLYFE